MADKKIMRNVFGLNGQRLENFNIASVDTYERWKNGELLFFPEKQCFASFSITDERNEAVEYMFDSKVKRDDEWHETWKSYSPEEKASWYWEFIRNNYATLTYEEFLADPTYVKQEIKVTFHLPNREIDGIVFYTPQLDLRKVEV